MHLFILRSSVDSEMALANLSLWYGVVLAGMLTVLGSSHPADSFTENAVKVNDKITKTFSLLKIFYPQGTGESGLPLCDRWSVCNRVDTYSQPWIERLCSCRNGQICSTSLKANDGHTVVDRTRQYKICEPVTHLPTCRFFKDVTWTHITGADNTKFQQKVHCQCPENSTAYISGRDIKLTSQGIMRYFNFSCSPESNIRCRRKEPCRLFTVRKRFPVEEVTTSTLCQCPPKTSCPTHHTDPFVISDFDSLRPRDGTRTYSGFCGSSYNL